VEPPLPSAHSSSLQEQVAAPATIGAQAASCHSDFEIENTDDAFLKALGEAMTAEAEIRNEGYTYVDGHVCHSVNTCQAKPRLKPRLLLLQGVLLVCCIR
jgi:hypothetical protein